MEQWAQRRRHTKVLVTVQIVHTNLRIYHSTDGQSTAKFAMPAMLQVNAHMCKFFGAHFEQMRRFCRINSFKVADDGRGALLCCVARGARCTCFDHDLQNQKVALETASHTRITYRVDRSCPALEGSSSSALAHWWPWLVAVGCVFLLDYVPPIAMNCL